MILPESLTAVRVAMVTLQFAQLLRTLKTPSEEWELTPMIVCRALRHVWILLMVVPIPALAGTARIYVTNSAGDSIHVIDPATNKVVQQIKGIEGAHGIAFSPDGSKVYVSDEVGSTLDVFDRKSGKLVKKVALSAHPNNIAVAKDGRIVVGIARDPGALDIIDPGTLTLTKSVPVNGRLHNVYVTPDNKYVVTGSIRTGIVTVIDLATEQPAWEVKFDKGIRPMAIEAAPDGSTKRIFVQLSDFNGFAVVDFAARKEVARVQLPAAKTEFETDGDRTTAPSHGIGVAPDAKSLWVTSIPNNAVYAYSLADLALAGEVALPSLKLPGHGSISAVANWVTFTPDSKMIYISNAGLRSVSAIDTTSMKLIAVIPVGEVPKRINTLSIPDGAGSAAISSRKRASLH
jgi:YVTN family beta-propeller protein